MVAAVGAQGREMLGNQYAEMRVTISLITVLSGRTCLPGSITHHVPGRRVFRTRGTNRG